MKNAPLQGFINVSIFLFRGSYGMDEFTEVKTVSHKNDNIRTGKGDGQY